MATEAPTSRCRGWLAALLWVLVLPAGMRGSWPVASRAPALAPDETEAQAKEPVLRGRGTEPLAPGAEGEGLWDRITGVTSVSIMDRVGGVSTVCGKPKTMGRIYGGRDVLAGQWPWQASLRYQRTHVCGAVLIDPLWLVSTAHCFLNKSHAPADYRVLLGSTRLYQHTPHTRELSLRRIVVHPDFEKHHPFGSDIVMLQLHLPVNLTAYIAPACLPSPGLQLSSSLSCWITGWGMLSEDSEGVWETRAEHLPSPFHLQEGKVRLLDNEFCNVLYGRRLSNSKTHSVQEEMVCAGDFSTGKAICQGDSGGPLVCDLPAAWVLVGLASWGLDCRHPLYPSVFTRVDYFTDWIHKTQRLTPTPDPTSAPQSPEQPLQAASSAGRGTALIPPQTWLLLLFALRDPRQALR
ncbi:putative serine protease 47 [Ursus americanus]|uniref:putative serine protease 47 n=1 Tax=Ursus americanus TaxID=9643 RepID=UPI001E67B46B|nr:putative serine protease 47 [Ursus americanus]